jgi:hypothetical protein
LSRGTIASILAVAERNRDRIDRSAIAPTVDWRRTSSTVTPSDEFGVSYADR